MKQQSKIVGSTPSSPEEKRRNKEAKKARRELRKKEKYSAEMYEYFQDWWNNQASNEDETFDQWFNREVLHPQFLPGNMRSWEKERRDKAMAARTDKSAGYPPPSPERLKTLSLFQGGAATLQPEVYKSGKTQKAT